MASMVVLWTALNHPLSGDELRRGISSDLRERDSAHLTANCGPSEVWCYALGTAAVDLDGLMAAAKPLTDKGLALGFSSAEGDAALH